VLDDNDYARLRQFGFVQELEAAVSHSSARPQADGPAAGTGDGHGAGLMTESLPEKEIQRRISEREAARRRGDFSRADLIRKELLEAGVILEDTKSGVRWKRK
jgi:cysteinyl-tRNA synthetase